MRKKLLRPLTFLTLLVTAVFIMTWVVSYGRSKLNTQQIQDVSKVKRQTLRERAREGDAGITITSEVEAEYSDLRLLAREANVIVLGRVIEVTPRFSESGDSIDTYHFVEVQRVLKDATADLPFVQGYSISPTPIASPLKVVRPGGEVVVNGHRAYVKIPNSVSLQAGKDYILFLRWSSPYRSYMLAGGNSGAVLVENNTRIQPLGISKELKAKKYEAFDLTTFIKEIINEP